MKGIIIGLVFLLCIVSAFALEAEIVDNANIINEGEVKSLIEASESEGKLILKTSETQFNVAQEINKIKSAVDCSIAILYQKDTNTDILFNKKCKNLKSKEIDEYMSSNKIGTQYDKNLKALVQKIVDLSNKKSWFSWPWGDKEKEGPKIVNEGIGATTLEEEQDIEKKIKKLEEKFEDIAIELENIWWSARDIENFMWRYKPRKDENQWINHKPFEGFPSLNEEQLEQAIKEGYEKINKEYANDLTRAINNFNVEKVQTLKELGAGLDDIVQILRKNIPLDYIHTLLRVMEVKDIHTYLDYYSKVETEDLLFLIKNGFDYFDINNFIEYSGTRQYAENYLNRDIDPYYISLALKKGFQDNEHDIGLVWDAKYEYHLDNTFSRFSKEDIRKVLEHDPDDQREVALIILPHHSVYFNELDIAFETEEAEGFFSKFIEEYNTYAYEIVDGIQDVHRAILSASEKQKIKWLIDGGHGERNSILYGASTEKSESGKRIVVEDEVTLEDEDELKRYNLGQYFSDNAYIFAMSCANGLEIGEVFEGIDMDNMGKMRSRVYKDVVVIASADSFRISQVKLDLDDSKYPIIVEDLDNTHYYLNGKLLYKKI